MDYQKLQLSNQDELVRIVRELRSFKHKDYSRSLEECEKRTQLLSNLTRYLRFLRNTNIPPNIVVNKKYPHFLQAYFTAGDEEQFIEATHLNDGGCYNPQTVLATFRYIFFKYKKALYVRIKDNRIDAFVPFTNADYTNEWGDRIRPPKWFKKGGVLDFLGYVNSLEGRPFNPRHVQKSTSKWYGNNCLFRYEFPFVEDGTSVSLLHNMFSELCKREKVPNIEFFVHKRDFPIRRKDRTESYDAIFGKGTRLVSHNYPFYNHILAYCTTIEHSDICIPTWEDWCIASQAEGKYFTDSCRIYDSTIGLRIPWKSKRPVAVFRGSTTGCGVTTQTNPRLKLVCLSSVGVVDPDDNLPYLDAGITKWNMRPRAINGELTTIRVDTPPLDKIYNGGKKASFLSPEDQAHYKYIINVDGHVSAFRISYELSLGSVVLYTDDSQYYTWITKSLKPWVHYVPIKSDLSDIYEKIKWCKLHDTECQEIAANARLFYEEFINKNYMLHYTATLFKSLAASPESK